jgi:RNA recognition motif-containing protein
MASRKRGLDESTSEEVAEDGSTKRARNPDGHAINPVKGRSQVLHVRSLPTFCTEQELIAMLAGYGDGITPAVTRALITQNNHQAFVQMSSLAAAEAVVQASGTPPGFQLRGRQVRYQISISYAIVEIGCYAYLYLIWSFWFCVCLMY